jgi:uncharacterized membrane protein
VSVVVIIAGYIIRSEVAETRAFSEKGEHGGVPRTPILEAFKYHWHDMLRVICMALMNVIPVVATIFGGAYAVQAAYGILFQARCICGFPYSAIFSPSLLFLWSAICRT